MAPGDTARLYHRLSSYRYVPGSDWPLPIDHPLVRQDFTPNDRPTFPAHRKVYPDSLPSVELPAAWPAVRAPTIDLLAGRHAPVARPLDLAGLIDGPDAARHRGPLREASNRRRTVLHG